MKTVYVAGGLAVGTGSAAPRCGAGFGRDSSNLDG